MNKKTLSALVLTSGILVSGAVINLANAQTTATQSAQAQPPQQQEQQKSGIQYPIKELGNCQNKNDCKVFCDDPKNSDACLAFAKQNNLMSTEEVAAAKKFTDNGMVGPGGCKGQAACDQYCGNSDHLEACITFAQKNGMMSDQQLQDSQKILTAVKNGLKPPACSGPKQCNAYCSSPEHMEECMKFSLAAGVVPDNQKEQMQKTLDAIKQGAKPPACQPNQPGQSGQPNQSGQLGNGLQSCDTYCSNPTHMEECMAFTLAIGQVPDKQKEQVQKTLTAIKQGIKPPACQPAPPSQSGQPGQPNQPSQANQAGQGLQACDQYCADPSHVEECVKFSVAVGNMTEQQAQTAIKTGGKGPGGCVGRDACDTFCNNPDNQETCFNFAKDNGMISQDQLQQMQAGQQKMKEAFSSIPPEVLDCLTSSVGADVVEKMKTGSVVGRKFGDSINRCFQKFGVREGTPSGNGPGSGQGGQPNQNQNGQGQQNQQGQPGQPGQNQIQNDLKCSPKGTTASFVCAKNGRNASGGPETTYFNKCTAEQDGAVIIHDGVCEGHKPCGDVADPVCGNDNNTWVSACYAVEQGGGVQYTGVCKNQSGGGQGRPGQNQPTQNQSGQTQPNQQGQQRPFQQGPGTVNQGGQQMPQQAGPGGCKGPEECQKYCASNPEVCKNFQPQQNQGQQGKSGQPNQPNQPSQPNQPNQPTQGGQGIGGPNDGSGPCGTGPGTCSGIGPDDINPKNGSNSPGGPNQGQGFNPGSGQNGNGPGLNQGGPSQPNQPGQPSQFNQGQPGQMQPQQQQQPQQFQSQQQPFIQQQNQPSPPSGFLQQTQKLLGNALNLNIFK